MVQHNAIDSADRLAVCVSQRDKAIDDDVVADLDPTRNEPFGR
jgi:hypothetical protein